MVSDIQNQYLPDQVSPPGDTLLETLEFIGMSQAELAERTGRPKKTINEIVKGKTAITPETALQFERVLGIPASFWNNRERLYREALARNEEDGRLFGDLGWFRQFPIREMVRLGWVRPLADESRQLDALLGFFGVASSTQWKMIWLGTQVSFRRVPAFESDPYAVSAWLRKGEISAQRIECAPYDEVKFRKALLKIRQLTTQPADVFQPEAMNLAAQAGIALVFVPEIPRTRLSGVTRWLSSDKGLIQLSLRYKSDDQLWFTFFHEAGHIILHKKRDVFIEDSKCTDSKAEAEANEFASDFLIPPGEFRRFVSGVGASIISRSAIQSFARRIGIAPGIVVGRLQHERLLRHSFCNALKRRLVWAQAANG